MQNGHGEIKKCIGYDDGSGESNYGALARKVAWIGILGGGFGTIEVRML